MFSFILKSTYFSLCLTVLALGEKKPTRRQSGGVRQVNISPYIMQPEKYSNEEVSPKHTKCFMCFGRWGGEFSCWGREWGRCRGCCHDVKFRGMNLNNWINSQSRNWSQHLVVCTFVYFSVFLYPRYIFYIHSPFLKALWVPFKIWSFFPFLFMAFCFSSLFYVTELT